MAITVTVLASGIDETDQSSYTTASISPTAGRVWLAAVVTAAAAANTDPPSATISGAGITWTSLGSIIFATDAGATRRRVQLFKGVAASPSSGALTIAYGGTTVGGCARSIMELTGADTTNPILSGSIVTDFSNSGSATSGSLTLASAAAAGNRPIAAFSHNTFEASSPRTNWTELSDLSAGNPSTGFEVEWRSDAFETTASASWATGGKWGGIAAEIATPAASTPQTCSATQAQTATAPRSASKVLVA